jgi:hypothetical protein
MPEPDSISRRNLLAAPAVWVAVAAGASAADDRNGTKGAKDRKPATDAAPPDAAPPDAAPPDGEKYETVTLRGRIVWQAEAMKRKFDVTVDPDAAKWIICLETPAGETPGGELVPIVKDFRGRGFHLDPKLHEFDWEFSVRRYPGSPFVQIVRSFVHKEGKRFEFDYWCDICAIPMYELKECECCQGPIRFRFRETP